MAGAASVALAMAGTMTYTAAMAGNDIDSEVLADPVMSAILGDMGGGFDLSTDSISSLPSLGGLDTGIALSSLQKIVFSDSSAPTPSAPITPISTTPAPTSVRAVTTSPAATSSLASSPSFSNAASLLLGNQLANIHSNASTTTATAAPAHSSDGKTPSHRVEYDHTTPLGSVEAGGVVYSGLLDGILPVLVRVIPASEWDAIAEEEERAVRALNAAGASKRGMLEFRGIEHGPSQVYLLYAGPATRLDRALTEGVLASLDQRIEFARRLLLHVMKESDVQGPISATTYGVDPVTKDPVQFPFEWAASSGSKGSGLETSFVSLGSFLFYLFSGGVTLGSGTGLGPVVSAGPRRGLCAAHLIRLLLDGRMDPSSVLEHPLFLEDPSSSLDIVSSLTSRIRSARVLSRSPSTPPALIESQTQYIDDVGTALVPIPGTPLDQALKTGSDGWKGVFDAQVIDHVCSFRSYDAGSILDLIFFVRNLDAHLPEFPDAVLSAILSKIDHDPEATVFHLRLDRSLRKRVLTAYLSQSLPSLFCLVFSVLSILPQNPEVGTGMDASWTTIAATARGRKGGNKTGRRRK